MGGLRQFIANVAWPRLGVLRQHAPRPLRPPPPWPLPGGRLPVISLVTPSLDQGRFLEHTLESVLGQGYPALEYVVQDGGSRDGTLAILERYRPRLAAVASGPDHGQSDAINRGFARTRGELMGWLNADDLLLPGALAYAATYFLAHPEVDAIYGHRVLIDAGGSEIGRWVMPRHDDAILSYGDFVPQETLLWRRSLWERTGARLDPTFSFAMDWELLLRFRDAGARIVRLPRFLGAFRVHEAQKTLTRAGDLRRTEAARLRQRTLGRQPSRPGVLAAYAPFMLRHKAHDLLYLAGRLRERRGA